MHKQLNSNICITCYYICTTIATVYICNTIRPQLYFMQPTRYAGSYIAGWPISSSFMQLHGTCMQTPNMQHTWYQCPCLRYSTQRSCMHAAYVISVLYNFVHYESNNIRTYVTDCKCTARGIAIQSHSSINAAQFKYSCSLSILSSMVAT